MKTSPRFYPAQFSSVVPVLGAITVLGLTGCAGSEPRPFHSQIQTSTSISGTAALAQTYLLNPESSLHICKEPPPDAAFDAASGGEFTLISIGDKTGESLSAVDAEQEMQGRTPGVVLTRELLYRLCEFSYNQKLDRATAIELYRANLAIIEKINSIEAERTDITISDGLTNQEVSSAPGQAGVAPLKLGDSPPARRAATHSTSGHSSYGYSSSSTYSPSHSLGSSSGHTSSYAYPTSTSSYSQSQSPSGSSSYSYPKTTGTTSGSTSGSGSSASTSSYSYPKTGSTTASSSEKK